jgi:uncharacterized phiE125 gp8 family phage protein
MNIKELTFPTTTIITLDEAKDHLRVTTTDEEELIMDCIRSATDFIEKYTDTLLLSRTYCAYYDSLETYKVIELWKYPITSISSVKYLNTSGVETTLDAANYSTDITDSPARILITSLPTVQSDVLNVFRIYYTAGFTNRDEMNPLLIGWVKIFTAFYYQTRQPEYTGAPVSEIANNYKQSLDLIRKGKLV